MKHILINTNGYEYLGITIESGLTFDTMSDDTYNKANCNLYVLKRIQRLITNSFSALIDLC